jgi:hypothetical protein
MADQSGNAERYRPPKGDTRIGKVGISRSCLYLTVAQSLTDHWQASLKAKAPLANE